MKQKKTGHWLVVEYEFLTCSVCGESYYTGYESTAEAEQQLESGLVYRFCPHCGTPMDSGRKHQG